MRLSRMATRAVTKVLFLEIDYWVTVSGKKEKHFVVPSTDSDGETGNDDEDVEENEEELILGKQLGQCIYMRE